MVIMREVVILYVAKDLSSLKDLRLLGDYSEFDIKREVDGDFTNIYAVTKQGHMTYSWLLRPIGGERRKDTKVSSFYVYAREGLVGLLYRSRENEKLFRIVCFSTPLKRFPRLSKRFRRK